MVQSVKIGPFEYAVQLIQDLKRGNRKLDGHISHNETTIKLEAVMSPQAQTQVLWHEILHGIAMQSNLDLSEQEVDVLSFGVYQVLKDNPDVVKMSTQKGSGNG